jgi:hypothetical protein
MTGVQPKQLWVSSEAEPQVFYVSSVQLDGMANVIPVRIDGTGRQAQVVRTGKTRRVRTSEMLDTWMPTTHEPDPSPTWHERIMADDEL